MESLMQKEKSIRKKFAAVSTEKGVEKVETQHLNATLSPVVGLRVIAVIEKGIERLQLLTLLNYDAYPTTAEQHVAEQKLEEAAPSGVGNILDEQKRMEQRYEELLIATSKPKHSRMDPTLDPGCYSDVDNTIERQQRAELRAISAQLKEYSKQLCRQLKENPNDSDNWKKVLNERAELTNLLGSCVRELAASTAAAIVPSAMQPQSGNLLETSSQRSGDSLRGAMRTGSQFAFRPEASYEVFAKRVIEEQNEKIWADEIVKREKETNMNVKHLQNEVTQERLLKEKEIEERQVRLAELKTQVRKRKQLTKEEAEKRKAETEAQAEARAREAKDTQRVLREKISRLEEKLQIEQNVFAQIERHLNRKSGQLQTKTADWTYREVEENKELDDQIMQERKKREDQVEKLKAAEERHAAEVERKKEKEETERQKEQEKKRWDDLQRSEYMAATKLQAAFKAFLIRKLLMDAKKKKKKPKGKKKGKA